MLRSTRKGRLYEGSYPVIHLHPMQVDPQYWIEQYCRLTSAYQGEELLCSLETRNGRGPLRSSTINSLTTRWLREHGVGLKYTAHSTRGAAATTLLHLGLSPGLVQAIGDWQNGDCFMKFYNRVSSMSPHQQIMIRPLLCPAPDPDSSGNPVSVKKEDSPSLTHSSSSSSNPSRSSLKIAPLPLCCHALLTGVPC